MYRFIIIYVAENMTNNYVTYGILFLLEKFDELPTWYFLMELTFKSFILAFLLFILHNSSLMSQEG